MSTLSNILDDLLGLFFERRCIVCGRRLVDGERDICIACRYSAPLTGFAAEADNPLFRRFWGVVPVERAAALLFFIRGSEWRRTIHSFKYEGRWGSARALGRWLGEELDAGGLFATVDTAVPVPLHPGRRLRRGYNQSEYAARGIADVLGIGVDTRALVRRRDNPSQTTLRDEEKRANVRDLFAVRRPERLRGRHILLVDDVITSGETVTACIEAIVSAVPDCRISVACIAASHSRYGGPQ